jgi:hypothetical protein
LSAFLCSFGKEVAGGVVSSLDPLAVYSVGRLIAAKRFRGGPGCAFLGFPVPNGRPGHHIRDMAKIHPHAEAAYRVITLDGGYFGVEVAIPETHPTTVSRFATEAEAEEWIARHKSRIQSEVLTQKWFRKIRPG